MRNKCVLRHLDWINHGYGFHDISRLRKKIAASTGIPSPGSEMVHHYLGLSDVSTQPANPPLEHLTFLFLDIHEFSGGLSFLEKASYLQTLHLGGGSELEQIKYLRPLSRLRGLRHLDLPNQLITDISPLSNNQELEEVNLEGNLIDSLEPLSRHRNLQRAAFSSIRENDIIPLLKSSQQAIISYENQEPCHAFWVDRWAFKGSFTPSGNRIEFVLEPIAEQENQVTQVSPQILRTLLKRCQEIGRSLVSEEVAPAELNITFDKSVQKLTGHLKYQSHAYS